MTICIGRPLIETLANEGAWESENGESVVAASDLFGRNPYAENERLLMALKSVADFPRSGIGAAEDMKAYARRVLAGVYA